MEFIPGRPRKLSIHIDESSYSTEHDPQQYRDLLLERALNVRSQLDGVLDDTFETVVALIWSMMDVMRFAIATEAPRWSFGDNEASDLGAYALGQVPDHAGVFAEAVGDHEAIAVFVPGLFNESQ